MAPIDAKWLFYDSIFMYGNLHGRYPNWIKEEYESYYGKDAIETIGKRLYESRPDIVNSM